MRLLTAVVFTSVVGSSVAVAAPWASTKPATLSTFAGTWIGHTRSLVITRSGAVHESIGDGCCDPIVDIWFRLTRPRGTTARASVSAIITRIAIHHAPFTGTIHRTPRVGDIAIFNLAGGVIDETLSGTNYCNRRAGAKGICGA